MVKTNSTTQQWIIPLELCKKSLKAEQLPRNSGELQDAANLAMSLQALDPVQGRSLLRVGLRRVCSEAQEPIDHLLGILPCCLMQRIGVLEPQERGLLAIHLRRKQRGRTNTWPSYKKSKTQRTEVCPKRFPKIVLKLAFLFLQRGCVNHILASLVLGDPHNMVVCRTGFPLKQAIVPFFMLAGQEVCTAGHDSRAAVVMIPTQ